MLLSCLRFNDNFSASRLKPQSKDKQLKKTIILHLLVILKIKIIKNMKVYALEILLFFQIVQYSD